MTTDWTEVLDAFEHRLAEQHAALARDEPAAVHPFVPPAGLGPLPTPLVPRARALLADADALTELLAGATRSTRDQLSLLGRLHQEAPSASFVDASL